MKKIFQIVAIMVFLVACNKDDNNPIINEKQEIISFINNEITVKNLNSVSFAVVKNGNLIWSDGVGFADKENNIKATAQTRYLIASISKTVTGVALMQLYEDGLFQLDDDINNHLPFSVRNPSFPNTPITFRMLCTHSSSLSDANYYNFNFYSYGSDSSVSLHSMMSQFYTNSGTYYSVNNFTTNQPGTTAEYTNMGIALMGYLVERISQQPFDLYCNEKIFTPLGMTKTSWRLAQTPINELAIPYTEPFAPTDLSNPHYTFADYPNGGLRTTVTDLSKFLIAILNNGSINGVSILSPTTVYLIKQKSGIADDVSEYALTFRYFDLDGLELFGHPGGESGVNTMMFADLNKDTGVIIFSNSTPESGLELKEIFKKLLQFAINQSN
jgi:hypothetical protein